MYRALRRIAPPASEPTSAPPQHAGPRAAPTPRGGAHRLANLVAPGPGVIQRTLTVKKVDFNPDEAQADDPEAGYKDSDIDVAAVRGTLRDYFADAGAAQAYPGGNAPVNNVYRNALRIALAGLGGVNLEARDIPTLADAVTAHLVGAVGIPAGEQGRIRLAVLTALAEHSFRLPAAKGTLFDEMIEAARANGTVSRAKGTPNQVPPGNLPGGRGGAVSGAIAAVRAANHVILAFDTVDYDATRTLPELLHDAIPPVAGRSPHHGKAGWLPAVAVPPYAKQFFDSFHGTHRSTEKIVEAGNGGDLHPGRLKRRKTAIAKRFNDLGSDRAKLIAVWSNYSQRASGVSFPYIEFNGPGLISRIVYDYVSDKFYATLHYQWSAGWNPFFEMTGEADL
ncbi:MAG: hypothetical protein JO225_01550 [Candidatus Eremiobacteraeota bacterium]|nr:hypothetical protein [Candidatus Eremiobacteraeota bacterium]MBV8642586.1 hypothetical protein [Candidatus Eremiobacteraeota bacterium]